MNDLELRPRAIELVKDEDVLSLGAQMALEQVGSALGILLALALLLSLLPRAGQIRAALGAPAQRGGEPLPESRESRDLERRAYAMVPERDGG